jgi:hypothetical protein
MNAPLDDCVIDRLVDGELTDGERRRLLLQLESTPGGWRRCALAFLEAGSWSAAFRAVALTEPREPVAALTPECATTRPRRWYPLAGYAALAASFVIVFVLGWVMHRTPMVDTIAAQQHPTQPPAVQTPLPKAHAPLAAHEPIPRESTQESALLDRVVKQWQQHGYQADRQTRLISVELRDGRRVQVPIEEFRVQYVGNRTY